MQEPETKFMTKQDLEDLMKHMDKRFRQLVVVMVLSFLAVAITLLTEWLAFVAVGRRSTPSRSTILNT